jgi:hypothetical protein
LARKPVTACCNRGESGEQKMTMVLEDSGPLPQAASKDKLKHRSKSFRGKKTKGINYECGSNFSMGKNRDLKLSLG